MNAPDVDTRETRVYRIDLNAYRAWYEKTVCMGVSLLEVDTVHSDEMIRMTDSGEFRLDIHENGIFASIPVQFVTAGLETTSL